MWASISITVLRKVSISFFKVPAICWAPLRLGIDQVYDGLGLGEVDPSIDIGSESEFTRFGDPGAFPDHDTEYF